VRGGVTTLVWRDVQDVPWLSDYIRNTISQLVTAYVVDPEFIELNVAAMYDPLQVYSSDDVCTYWIDCVWPVQPKPRIRYLNKDQEVVLFSYLLRRAWHGIIEDRWCDDTWLVAAQLCQGVLLVHVYSAENLPKKDAFGSWYVWHSLRNYMRGRAGSSCVESSLR
jgi:hypothetical protein